MSAIVKSGYSPPEQYSSSGRVQGPWSDIYTLGATLFRALTGTSPPEATERMLNDTLKPVSLAVKVPGNWRPSFLQAIDAALRLKPTARPQSVNDWRLMLLSEQTLLRGPEDLRAGYPASLGPSPSTRT